jgi:hypothetical protein
MNLQIEIDKFQRASESTSNAVVAMMFGRPDEAARLHARAAQLYWRMNLISNAIKSVQMAADCLLDAGMADEAFDGMRTVTVMLVKRRDIGTAYDMADHLKVLCLKDPAHFGGAWESMSKYIEAEECKIFKIR